MKINEDIWPDERAVLESPHRLEYVRRLVKPKGCVFCSASKAKASAESLVIFKSQSMMVVLNKYPYNNGHILVTPRRHVADFEKLTEKELRAFTQLVKESLKILKKVYSPDGFNMGMNLGKVAGAGIPAHLHHHIIPRWGGDTNFFPLIGKTKLVVETSEQSYNQLRPYFAKLEKKGVI
ncbi:MAG: HIT domain-containing protein [Bdellovibrionales bacterium]|nr:HIT domain-containing protein [Bdellovibrionales bacterium]